MTGYLLIRHASADHVGRRLAGRSPGVHLDDAGRTQAEGLAGRLADVPLAAVYSSPLERTLETAAPIAARHGLEPRASDAFVEVDVGEWTGSGLEELEGDEAWRAWNRFRSTARPPGGESAVEVLERALGGVRELGHRHADEWIAVVSHSGVIRALLAHFAGIPLDQMLRLEIGIASVSTVEVHPWGPRILGVNATSPPPWPTRTAGGESA